MVDKIKLQNFEDSRVWQDSVDLAVDIYKFTKTFPQEERFGISSQLQRAATSVSANVAEGFGRQSKKEKSQFYSIAYGSLLETKSSLYVSEKLGYPVELAPTIDKIEGIQKQINAIKRAINA